MVSELVARLSDPALVETRERHFARLEDLFAGRPLKQAFVLSGISAVCDGQLLDDPAKWTQDACESLARQSARSLDPEVFRPLVLENWLYGVHFIDHLLGANTYFSQGQFWADFLSQPVGRLEMPDIEKSQSWRKAKEFALACAEFGGTAPLICTQVLSSPLNIIVNLYGQEVLAAMIYDEEAVRRDLRVITDLSVKLHRWFQANIPARQFAPVVAAGRCQPRGFGQICGCTSHLVSAQMYRDLFAPLDDEVLSLYPRGGLIHLCGSHTHHIPVWRELKSFRAFQINDRAAEDLEIYFKELRDDQVIYLNPTPTMTVQRAMAITRGRRLVIATDLPESPLLD